MTRTERRQKTKEEIIPKVNAMLAAMEDGKESEAEVRLHTSESMWVLRLQMMRVV